MARSETGDILETRRLGEILGTAEILKENKIRDIFV